MPTPEGATPITHHNYASTTLEQKLQWVAGGRGPEAVAAAVALLDACSSGLAESERALAQELRGLADGWHGQASDAARSALTRMLGAVQDGQRSSRSGAAQLAGYAESYARLKQRVEQLGAARRSPTDLVPKGPGGGLGSYGTRLAGAVNEANNEAADQAFLTHEQTTRQLVERFVVPPPPPSIAPPALREPGAPAPDGPGRPATGIPGVGAAGVVSPGVQPAGARPHAGHGDATGGGAGGAGTEAGAPTTTASAVPPPSVTGQAPDPAGPDHPSAGSAGIEPVPAGPLGAASLGPAGAPRRPSAPSPRPAPVAPSPAAGRSRSGGAGEPAAGAPAPNAAPREPHGAGPSMPHRPDTPSVGGPGVFVAHPSRRAGRRGEREQARPGTRDAGPVTAFWRGAARLASAGVTIAVLGNGVIGRGLARRWTRAGYTVLTGQGNTLRRTDTAEPEAVPVADGLRRAEVLVLAAPAASVDQLVAEHRDGFQDKIVLDATIRLGDTTLHSQDCFHGQQVRYCRAFGARGWAALTAEDDDAELCFSAPDADTAERVADLVTALGLRPVHLGNGPAAVAAVDTLARRWLDLLAGRAATG